MLRGKHKVTYTPNQEMGDFVVIINAGKAIVTGNKPEGKMYHHHTGFVGGLISMSFNKLMERHPEDPILLAVKGMLPKGPLGRKLLTNVKVYAGDTHPHAAQNPQAVEV
jgi:large subunit ribosomal protein L13